MKRLTYEQIARVRLRESEAAQLHNRFPVIVILENIRSLYNVGSIFRTADACRLEALFTVGYTPHPPRPEIDKTALGATRTVPSAHFATTLEAISEASAKGFAITSLEITDNKKSVFALAPPDFPLAIVIGNEITGVSEAALAASDYSIEIPMLGAKHSLNVAVATGIALFECVRIFGNDVEQFRPKDTKLEG